MSQPLADLLGWVHKSDNLQFSLERALTYARERSHPELTLEHLLLTLADDPIAATFLEACDADVMHIRSDALNFIDKQLKPVIGSKPVTPEASEGLQRVMAHASAAAEQSGRPLIDGAIVLAALIGDGESQAARILQSHGLTFEVAIERLSLSPDQRPPDNLSSPPKETPPPPNAERSVAKKVVQPTAEVRPVVPSEPIAAQSIGTGQANPSQSDSGPLEVPPPVGRPAEKTAERTAPTIDEIQSIVSEMVANGRNDAKSAPVRSKAPKPQKLEPAPQTPNPAARSEPIVRRPPNDSAPQVAPAGDTNPRLESSSSSSQHAATGISSPPGRAGVTQWPFAWQETPKSVPANPPAIEDSSPGNVSGQPPVPAPAARLVPAPAQDNRSDRLPVDGPPGNAGLLARPPSPSDGPSDQGWARILPAGDSGHEPDAPKAPELRQDADTSRLSETIPRTMRAMVPKPVEVVVRRIDVTDIDSGDEENWRMERRQAFITEAVTVQLKAPDGVFLIENITPDTQWIDHRLGLIHDDLTSWRWTVTPSRSGRFRLQLVVSARTVSEHGTVAESALPERIIEVRVRSNYVRAFGRFAGFVIAAAIGGLLARNIENALELGRKVLEIIQ